MVLELVIVLLVILFVYIIMTYNSLITAQQKVRNSWAQIDVQLKKRADVVYNIVELVKTYAKYEKKTLENITKQRSGIINSSEQGEIIDKSNQLTKTFKTIFAVAENYPELKANDNFLELQKQLILLENEIAYARMVYNDVVTIYNTKILSFPQNLLAPLLKFKPIPNLEATELERASVAVKL